MTLPNKVQIFLAGMYLWSCITLYTSKIAQWILSLFIKFVPNYLVITDYGPQKFNEIREKIQIINVESDEINLTDKFNLFINWFWDNNLCEETGGIDFNKIKPLFKTSILYITYLFNFDEYFTKENHKKYMEYVNHVEMCLDTNQVKLNFKEAKDVMFNQFSFNPEFSF